MEPIDIAKKLGETISVSKEYIRLMQAEKSYKANNEAINLIKKFKKTQHILESTVNRNIDATKIRKELTALFNEIQNNRLIKELNDALNEFLILKQRVYESIEEPIKIDKEILSLNNRCKGNCGGCKK
ncbi:YlbF family regulator [Paramaledivibacter caminithermalis]|jgi:cell fate (sporulation/competence/biofilm development) regulator YlbF (YheA/YmcA/DUF963 family)|uniref:Cell fate regulator YlbF, YheA/YmcA/DUF963 family (Controls sporulation, competence, biofilm development) n=1 Tax=Paramaledivibacter caminithermalis (strain DSM 15212 / CIP 107654 / DViRD3) TaxID=1121301 RepID=A0A1M6JL18_PARC5|nr:YlbF family regulator [Paramaledivibacter caminithermalis]SHJ47370.1 Cell fate regulator YlbF, YheA/YmcA/DUF963 family (controls sporulation, competence, biofilm development) [Paramaledivibacter caminithermalis DSM 15212]